MQSGEMKVTYIDPTQRHLFAAPLPDGGFAVWAQRAKEAPRKLVCRGYIDPDGYPDFGQAQDALDRYVSWKRSESGGWKSWEVLVNGKETEWDDYHAMVRGELLAPVGVPANAIVTLANIEYRIAHHMKGAYENIIEVGRCLCEAKDAGLVPHGQWEAWVRQNTGMSERSAQKLMQTARSVHSGSSLAQLPVSKITTILSLPEPEREGMAERAITEDMTLRELQEAVKREKQRADQLAATQVKTSARAAAAERELAELKADLPKQAESMAAEYAEKATEEIDALRARLAEAEARAAQAAERSDYISPEVQAQIDRLTNELAEAESYAERQAELRQQAQQELLNQRAQAVRGESAQAAAFGPAELAAAVQAFVCAAGVLPHLGASIAQISEGERAQMRQYVDMVDTWVAGARRTLATIVIGGEV